MKQQYSREINFNGILNFRDLGGYKAGKNRKVAWRRLFRSGELHCMTQGDLTRLKEEIKVKTIIDLRSPRTIKHLGTGPVKELGVKYFHVPFNLGGNDQEIALIRDLTSLGDEYLYRIKAYGPRIVEALGIIADATNHPLVFHCNAGKDRSGMLSAIILEILGVTEGDIAADYMLTELSLKKFIERWNNDARTEDVHRNLPEYHLKTSPEGIISSLSMLRAEYGSIKGFLTAQGAKKPLFSRLEKALLV